MYKPAMIAGTLFAALAVILGAFGAHALKARLPIEQLAVFETGVRYHFYHAFALLITGIAYSNFPFKSVKLASTFFIIGILLFSGSLYAMALLHMFSKSIGPAGVITPIGGLFFIMGWIELFLGVVKKK
jgi:uncharacterized membrane protein YgdD (TMEM256/DUF423 family)